MLRLQRFTRSMTHQHPTRLASGARRLHYAWVIVTVSSLICMIISPMRFAISMLVPHLQNPEGFGWSYFAISAAFALQWLCTALFSPLVGWLGDRYGVRRTLLLGAGLFIAGMLLTGSMTGPTNTAMREVIATDPDAYWDPATSTVKGSQFAQSPRIIFLPVHDPRVPVFTGGPRLQVTKIVAFFMEQMEGNAEVRGRFLRAIGTGETCPAAGDGFVVECPTPAQPTSWGRVKNLYR